VFKGDGEYILCEDAGLGGGESAVLGGGEIIEGGGDANVRGGKSVWLFVQISTLFNV
jgi:hypothetical protein